MSDKNKPLGAFIVVKDLALKDKGKQAKMRKFVTLPSVSLIPQVQCSS